MQRLVYSLVANTMDKLQNYLAGVERQRDVHMAFEPNEPVDHQPLFRLGAPLIAPWS
jgi:hypothetical protein